MKGRVGRDNTSGEGLTSGGDGEEMLVSVTKQGCRINFELDLRLASSLASGKQSQHSHWYLVTGVKKVFFPPKMFCF